MIKTKLVLLGLLAVLLPSLFGCASSGPATQYYSLFPAPLNADYARSDKSTSFGVGPVVLPEYLENSALVSLDSSHQLKLSGYRAWAGDLKSAISRVISTNLASLWQIDGVWSFPWDTRARPDYQIRIVLDKFDGERGGTVSLLARWQIIDQKQHKAIFVSSATLSRQTEDDSVEAYVAALNALLTQLSVRIAEESSI
ncbi:hypothetical protein SAMN02745866_01434 [Alteromonadaceae bacterium Bs31]|nr:hypothetical protein SAMN02745866_01434 [Alteromonadaceae bacterium Bs31]